MDIEELNNEETAHEISELFAKKEFHKIKNILIEINPTDIAAIFDELPKEQMLLLFRLLPKEEAAETFVELDGDMQEALITAFSDTELKEVIDELYLDDTVEEAKKMMKEVVEKVASATDAVKEATDFFKEHIDGLKEKNNELFTLFPTKGIEESQYYVLEHLRDTNYVADDIFDDFTFDETQNAFTSVAVFG